MTDLVLGEVAEARVLGLEREERELGSKKKRVCPRRIKNKKLTTSIYHYVRIILGAIFGRVYAVVSNHPWLPLYQPPTFRSNNGGAGLTDWLSNDNFTYLFASALCAS